MPRDAGPGGGRKRFLFVLEHFPPYVGGVETLFGHLVTTLVAAGHDVRVVTSRVSGAPAREHWNGALVIRIPGAPILRRYLFTLLAIPYAVAHARKADIVHTTLYNAALAGWIAARSVGACAVLSVHEVWGRQWMQLPGMSRLSGLVHGLFEWMMLRLPFDHFTCISEFTRERLIRSTGKSRARTSVVYPAVDYAFWNAASFTPAPIRAELSLPDDTFLYLYFGRPGVSKGVEYLVDAAAQVSKRMPASRLLLILGDDPKSQFRRIRRRIAELGLEDHVVVRPPVARGELPRWLLAADCVVVPSVSEGFGYSAVEAAALGCKVVATSGHSVAEVIPHGATFVPARDPSALANAIVAARQTPAPQRPEPRYTLENHLQGMLEVYESACAS